MKYISIILAAFLFAQFSTGCATRSQKSISSSCVVSDDEAVFVFPISSKDTYEWNAASDNALEYSCMAVFGDYSFGYTLFKHPASNPASGSINELLSAGQCNAWESREYMKNVTVTIKYENENLVVTLEDKDLIQELFAEKPKTYTVDMFGFDYNGASTGAIAYETAIGENVE